MKIEELETIVRSVGMDAGLMSMGAASCIYSEGCEGVTMDDLLKLVAALEEHALALQAESEARDAAWQPIETCPQTGFFLVTEDTCVRALWRYEGKWESPEYPAIMSEYGDLIVGDDAKRLTGGRPLVVSQGVRDPHHWRPVPEGVPLPDEDEPLAEKEQTR